MTSDVLLSSRDTLPAGEARAPRAVIFWLTARASIRSGVLWGVIFGVVIAAQEVTYPSIYKTGAQRAALARTVGGSSAMSALFGPARDLGSVGGFVAFKLSITFMIAGAVWGLLTSTRLLRGEEDAGRWDLLLAGQQTRRGATTQAAIGLGAGAVALWAVSSLLAALTGHRAQVQIGVTASLFFALCSVSTAAMFLAVGSVTSQLAATRRQAASFAAVFLGGCYALRLLADAGVGLHALIWVSPLGWVEQLDPLVAPDPIALLPIAGFIILMVLVARALAGRRDVGASVVPDRTHARARLGLLRSPMGLALRMQRAVLVSWWLAVGISAFLFGFIAKSIGGTISGSVHEVLAKLGGAGTGAEAALGVCFLVEAVLLGFLVAGQVTAARGEEASGRVELLLIAPVTRWRWLGGRCVIAVVALLLAGVLSGLCAWLGAATQHSGLSASALLAAGVNLVPPSLVILGAGVLTLGLRPRWSASVVYAVLGWSVLVVILGGFGTTSRWVLDTSVFHHMASAPGVAPNWTANGIMAVIGIAGMLLGSVALHRRDLEGG